MKRSSAILLTLAWLIFVPPAIGGTPAGPEVDESFSGTGPFTVNVSGTPLTGFEEDGFTTLGTSSGGTMPSFNATTGTYDLPSRQTLFIPVGGPFDVYQSNLGLARNAQAIDGRMEWLVEWEDLEFSDSPDPPNADVSVFTQGIVMLMDFGDVTMNGGPFNLEFLQIQLTRTLNGEYSLGLKAVIDSTQVATASPIRNLRDEGWLDSDQEVSAIDLKVVIDTDTVNGGSKIDLFHDINNSGTFIPFHMGADAIDGLVYPVDLTMTQTVDLHAGEFTTLWVTRGALDPKLNGAAASMDRFVFGETLIPEPGSLMLAVVAGGKLIVSSGRRRSAVGICRMG